MGRLDVLKREDLWPGRRVLYQDRFGFLSLLFVWLWARRGRLVVFRQAMHSVQSIPLYGLYVAQGHLREFSYLPFRNFDEYWRADNLACDSVEAVYADFERQCKVPAVPLVNLYQEEEIGAAFKKALALRIREFYQDVVAMRLLAREDLQVEGCLSGVWEKVGQWLDLAGVHWEKPCDARISHGFRLLAGGAKWFKWYCILFSYPLLFPLWALLRRCKTNRSGEGTPRPIQAALRVYTTDWGFRGEGTREIDWLLEGKQLHQDNTLFVVEKPISPAYRAELAARRYQVEDVSGPPAVLFSGMGAWIKLLVASIRAPGLFVEVAVRGWLDYLRWTAFLERWRPRHYVAYNHFHYDHVFRNVLLRKAGCESWYYVHSVHDRCAFLQASPEGHLRSQTGWMYLSYDHEIHWGRRDAELYRGMAGRSRDYRVCGPLWSDEVRSSPKLRDLPGRRMEKGMAVAIFDSSFGHDSPYDEQDALEFFEALRALLERPEWSSAVLLYKPKNALSVVRDRVPSAAPALENLLSHQRCVELPPEIAPGAAIAEADLTISLAFTSTTVEALGARRRALYFDPRGKYRHSYYEQFPNLVAHDRDELARLGRHWLDMPDADFQKYLDDRLAPEFGGHMDACAVERFREALTHG